MYIGNLAESVDSGVCPAGAVNLDRASFQTAEYDLNLALDGGIGGVLPLPAVVAGCRRTGLKDDNSYRKPRFLQNHFLQFLSRYYSEISLLLQAGDFCDQ